MTTLGIAEWAPDMPDLAEATSVIQNAFPLTAESYGPVNGLVNISTNALDNTCLGVFSVQDFDLVVYRFAGTVDRLYYDTANAWIDATNTGQPYTTPAGENWRFAVFNDSVFATNYKNAMQVFDLGVSTNFRDNNLLAPIGRFIAAVKGFLVVANLIVSPVIDPTTPKFSNRLWWCSFGDPTAWPQPGTDAAQQTMSDFEDIPGDPGPITGLAASLAGCDMAIFFARGVWRGFFVGPPDVFDFYPAQAGVRGTIYSNSLIIDGGLVYYRAQDGFASFDGSQSQRIGDQKVDQWFAENVNNAFPENVTGAVDVVNKRLLWAFPSTASVSGKPDTIIAYHMTTGRWGKAVAFSPDWLTTYIPIGEIPSNSAIGAINQGKLASFTGPTQAAVMTTKMVQPTPGRRTFIQSTRPLLEIGSANPNLTIEMLSRVNYNDPDAVGAAIAPDASGECPQRVDARYFRGQLSVAAGVAWDQCLGVEVTQSIPSGSR